MSKKIKLVHLLPKLSGGGAEKVCQQILLEVDKNKYQAFLILFKDNDIIQAKLEKEKLKGNGIKIISLKKKYLFDLFNFFQIIKNLKKINPDILHCHLGADIYGPLALFFNKKIKIISTEHNINRSEKKLARFLKIISLRRVNKVCAVSLAVKNDAIKRYNISENKIDLIYNGVDLNDYKLIKNDNINKEKVLLGSMGRLNQQKGHEILIKACALLKNNNYFLEIAGQGELRDKLNKQINYLKLNNNIKLVGQVNSKIWLNKIDIFIMPSLWEGLGLAVLEAAALKKPIIASAVDGIVEILNDNNSFLYKNNDPYKLAEKIDYLIEKLNTSKINEKSKLAYSLVVDKFGLNKMIDNYQNIYENITGQ